MYFDLILCTLILTRTRLRHKMGRYGYFSMELRLSVDIKIVILLSIMRLLDFFFYILYTH